MRATVEDDAAVGTHLVREARGLAARLVAEPAVERSSYLLSPALGFQDPGPEVERRLVAHVLLVSAGELGDPVSPFVLGITDDCALHPARVRALRLQWRRGPE